MMPLTPIPKQIMELLTSLGDEDRKGLKYL